MGPTDRPGEARSATSRPPGGSGATRSWLLLRGAAAVAGLGAWWTFEAGEERPEGDDEPVRLAELGELTAEELAALREAATEAKLRVGNDSERISGGGREHGVSLDARDLELWEAVLAARKAG